MSKAARDWYLKQKIADGQMKNVLSQLTYMHHAETDLFPSQKTIAEMAGISPRTVWAALRLLEYCGVIKRRPRKGKNNARLSDIVDLQLDDSFNLNRRLIGDARVALGLAPTVPKHWHRTNWPPRKDCDTPSQPLRRNSELVEVPYQEAGTLSGGSSTKGGEASNSPWPGFKVIAGGRQ